MCSTNLLFSSRDPWWRPINATQETLTMGVHALKAQTTNKPSTRDYGIHKETGHGFGSFGSVLDYSIARSHTLPLAFPCDEYYVVCRYRGISGGLLVVRTCTERGFDTYSPQQKMHPSGVWRAA